MAQQISLIKKLLSIEEFIATIDEMLQWKEDKFFRQ
jgi:hypothetical protein